jgi:hypothetical protein
LTMAVDFFRSMDVLIAEFQRRGLRPQVVETSGGTPPRTAQIRLTDRITVHWDGESRIVWAEGPWPEFEEIENYIRRRFAGNWLHRASRPDTAKRLIVIGVWLALVFGIIVPLLRSRDPIPPPRLHQDTVVEQGLPETTESATSTPATVIVLPRQTSTDAPAATHRSGLKFDDTPTTTPEPIDSAADPFRAHTRSSQSSSSP